MTFRPLLLAKPWTPKIDPTGYWLSAKLDGIRAYWDGDGTLWSRLGKEFKKAPTSFIERLPKGIPLDGELYLGAGRFNDTVRAVKGNAGWDEIRYVVFDAPCRYDDIVQSRETFEERIEICSDVWDDVAPQHKCLDFEHLLNSLDTSIAAGYEGIMLRKPESLYEGKRSSTLLKAKKFLDCEVSVRGHVPGKGKHVGRLGALVCSTDTGIFFEVGTGFDDFERANPPNVGDRITVKFQEWTPRGAPRFPVYVTVRDYE